MSKLERAWWSTYLFLCFAIPMALIVKDTVKTLKP